MRNLIFTTAALLLSLSTAAPAQAAPEILLNSGYYVSGIDQKPTLKITPDESGRTVQIEGPRLAATTLSANENHNFDTTTPIDSGIVSKDFIRKCAAKAGREKPCDKGLYDEVSGKLRIQEGDEYSVTARLLVLSSDSVIEAKWTTWTRDGSIIARKVSKDVLKWEPPAKTGNGSQGVNSSKDPIAL